MPMESFKFIGEDLKQGVKVRFRIQFDIQPVTAAPDRNQPDHMGFDSYRHGAGSGKYSVI